MIGVDITRNGIQLSLGSNKYSVSIRPNGIKLELNHHSYQVSIDSNKINVGIDRIFTSSSISNAGSPMGLLLALTYTS